MMAVLVVLAHPAIVDSVSAAGNGELTIDVEHENGNQADEVNALIIYQDGSYYDEIKNYPGVDLKHTFSNLPTGHDYKVNAYIHDQFAGSTGAITIPADNGFTWWDESSKSKTISVDNPIELSPTVYHSDGSTPLEGAYVRVTSHEDDPDGPGKIVWRSATTESDGETDPSPLYLYPTDGDDPGKYTLEVLQDGEEVASREYDSLNSDTAPDITTDARVPEYDLSVSADPNDGGDIDGEPFGSVEQGTEIQLTADPDSGYEFDHWSGDYPSGSREDTDISVTVTEDKSLAAHFEEIPEYDLSVSSSSGGTVDASQTGSIQEGTDVSLTVDANQGYKFSHWSGDYPSGDRENPTISVAMNQDRDLTANFERLKRDLTVDVRHQSGDRAEEVNALVVWQDEVGNGPYKKFENYPSVAIKQKINNLPGGHRYKINAYINDQFAGTTGWVNIENSDKSETINVDNPVWIKPTVYYTDGSTPLEGATVKIKSHEGTQWRSSTTGGDGLTSAGKLWLFPTNKGSYTIKILNDGERIATKQITSLNADRDIEITTSVPIRRLDVDTTGSGGVEVFPPGLSTQSLNRKYVDRTEVELVANSGPDHKFAGWEGDIGDADPESRRLEVTMSDSRDITATFDRKTNTDTGRLTVNIKDQDKNTVVDKKYQLFVDGNRLDPNTEEKVVLAPGTYQVTVEPTDFGTDEMIKTSKTVTIEEGRHTSVTLIPFSTRTYSLDIDVPAKGGGVSVAPPGVSAVNDVSQTYEQGTEVTVTANPTQGYEFIKWNAGSQVTTPTQKSIKFAIRQNKTLSPEFEKKTEKINQITWTKSPPKKVNPSESFKIALSGYAEGDGDVCLRTYPSRGNYPEVPMEDRCKSVSKGEFNIEYSINSAQELIDLDKRNFHIERFNRIRVAGELTTNTGILGAFESTSTSDDYTEIVPKPTEVTEFPYEETSKLHIPTAHPDTRQWKWMGVRVMREKLSEPNKYRISINIRNAGKDPGEFSFFEDLDGHPNSQLLILLNDSNTRVSKVQSTANGQTAFIEGVNEFERVTAPLTVASDIASGGLKYAAKKLITTFAKDIAFEFIENNVDLGIKSELKIPVDWQNNGDSNDIRVLRINFTRDTVGLGNKISEINSYTLTIDIKVTSGSAPELVILPDMRGKFIHQESGAGASPQHRYLTEYRRQITVPLPSEQTRSPSTTSEERAEISSVTPPDGEFHIGENVRTTATIRNAASKPQTFFVGYSAIGPSGTSYDNDNTTGTQVRLSPGETRTVDLSWNVKSGGPSADADSLSNGKYDLVVAVWNESDRVNLNTKLDQQVVENQIVVNSRNKQSAEAPALLTFTNQTIPSGSSDIGIDTAQFGNQTVSGERFVIVVHKTVGETYGSEIGPKIGKSDVLSAGTQHSVEVDLSQTLGPSDDMAELTESQSLVAMLHRADTTDGDDVTHGAHITRDGAKVTSRAQLTVSSSSETGGTVGDLGADVTRSVSSESITSGGEVTITTEVTDVSVTANGSVPSVSVPEVNSATIQSVTVNDAPVGGETVIEEATTAGSAVTLSSDSVDTDVTPSVTVTVTETVTVGNEPGVTHSITGNVTVGETAVDADPVSVTVTPLEGAAGEFDADGDGEIDIGELSQAAAAFIDGDLSIGEISQIAAEFIN
jgi:hypothetical protein